MYIAGIQKLSLLDYPGLIACTVFTAGCNYACPFCHNAELVRGDFPPAIPTEELFAFLRERRGRLDAVCISGGEPLLQNDHEAFIRTLRELGYRVKLDHNGSLPDRLGHLLEEGLLDYVAIDIKNAPDAYAETTGIPKVDSSRTQLCLERLRASGLPFECRTTVVRELHDARRLKRLAAWIRPYATRYYLQRFTDQHGYLAQTCGGMKLSAYSDAEMDELLRAVQTVIPEAERRG